MRTQPHTNTHTQPHTSTYHRAYERRSSKNRPVDMHWHHHEAEAQDLWDARPTCFQDSYRADEHSEDGGDVSNDEYAHQRVRVGA